MTTSEPAVRGKRPQSEAQAKVGRSPRDLGHLRAFEGSHRLGECQVWPTT